MKTYTTNPTDIENILLAHGGGGILTRRLIEEEIAPRFANELLNPLNDSAIINIQGTRLAFTTDSFVVHPIFFHGGDIGTLAVCGTVNDLAMAGANPVYLSCGFIIEEGFPMNDFQTILESMKRTAKDAGVTIVTGDTKVVERNAAEGIFINTSGIGLIDDGIDISSHNAKSGDSVIINGAIGDHGIAVLSERQGLEFQTSVTSDVAPLGDLVQGLLKITPEIHCMRDPTRGGLATALNEIANSSHVGIRIYEDRIPIHDSVRGACDMLGLDPLHVANEGKVIIVCPKEYENKVLDYLSNHPLGKESSVIGEVIEKPKDTVLLKTTIGGERIVDVPYGEDLPRIC
jgi:hydrogenase expression/formation protein HypE